MILIEETYKKYGYYPDDLSRSSHKPILAKCDDCGKIRETSKNAYRLFCSSCVLKGERNHMYGKSKEKCPAWTGGKTKRTCLRCGKQFSVWGFEIRRGGGKYCSLRCIVRWKVQHGKANPNWKGGISFKPYCIKFNKELKERIRERDDRTCQLCGVKENGEKLTVHHIHYDKPNCNPDLISLCRVCNSKANSNRDYYEEFFMRKLMERGILK